MSKPLPAGLKLVDEIIDLAGQVDAISKSQAIASFGLDGMILSANRNFLDLFGYAMGEIEGRHHSMFVEPAYAESAEYRQFWSILHNGQFQAAEFKRIGKDGREIWLQASYNPILGFDGRPSKVMKFATDVTERKRNEALLAGQVNAIAKSQAVIEFAMDGTVLAANQNYLAILGYELAEIVGRHHRMFVDPAYRESAAYGAFWDALRSGAHQADEFKRIGKDGGEVWMQAAYNPIPDLHGAPCKVVKFATDITARKRAETQVVALEAKFLALRDTPDDTKLLLFESIVVHARDAILITEAEPRGLPGPRIVYANPAFVEMTGYSLEDITGKTPRMFQGPLTGTEAPARIRAALNAWQPIQIEIFNYHKNGEGFWLELSISPLCNEKGWYTHWISVQRDITARKREQERLRKSEHFLARTASLAGIGGWELELATGELFWSAETYRIHGLEPGAALTLENAISFYAPEARDMMIAAVTACSQDGVPFDIEIPFIRANGERIWTRAIGSAEFADGKPFRISGLFQDIDKQVKERLALQQANDTLNLAKQAGRIGIWTWEFASDEIICDATIHRLYGVPDSSSESFRETWLACLHEEDHDAVALALQDGASGKADFNTQFRIVQPGGALRHVRASGVVSRDPAGSALRMTGALWDVTREETENLALKQAAARTKLAADSGGIGIWEWDIPSGEEIWDSRMRRLYDLDPADGRINLELWKARLHPEDRDAAEQALMNAVAGPAKFDTSFRVIWRDGSVHYIRGVADVTRDAAGTALRMLGVNWDVTAKFAENLALRQANARTRLATDSGCIGIWDWDIVHDEMLWDDWMCRLYDVQADPSAISDTYHLWSRRLHPEDREAAEKAAADAIAGIAPFDTSFRVVWRDGSVRHIRANGEVTRDAAGAAVRMVGVNWDVTAQVAQTQALQEVTTRMMLAADGGGIGILEFDVQTNVMLADEWACRIFGIAYMPGAAVPGDLWKLRIHPDDRARRDQARQDALDGIAPYALEYRIIREDGAVRHVECSGAVTRNAAGQALRMTGSVQDITARKETQEALAATARELERSNEELNLFASIASHDLQEPLRMVASYTQLLGKRYKGKLDADADDFIGYAVDGAQRMQRLIQDLLAYSRVGTKGMELRRTGAETALEGALWNLQGAIEQSGAIVTHGELPSVLADESQLVQLFQNLVGNAIKYRGVESPLIDISAARLAGGRWRFVVRDNGLGIDAQHFERIFGMFQRLHGVGEHSGTGIGLAICKKIVDRHGGVIGVESRPDEGSAFHFTLAGVAAVDSANA